MTEAEQKVHEQMRQMAAKLRNNQKVPIVAVCETLLEAAALLLERNAPLHTVTRTYGREGWDK